jgi:hypothetical protein
MNSKHHAGPPDLPRGRGRPPKFGRPARLVAVTLPRDVVEWLANIDRDLGRAIVRLHDQMSRSEGRPPDQESPDADLVDIGEGKALIVVEPSLVRGLEGVAAIPFGEGRAFLALEPSWTMADLELSVVDALDRGAAREGRRASLEQFRDQLRAWRMDRSIVLESRAIIVLGRRHKGSRGRRRA